MGDKVAHDLGLMQALERHAGQLQGVVRSSPYLAASLGKAQAGQIQELLDAQAGTLRSRAASLREGAIQSYTSMLDKAEDQRTKRSVREQEKALASAEGKAGHAMGMAEGRATLYEKLTPDIFRSGATKAHYFSIKAQGADEAADLIEKALAANPLANARLRSRLTDAAEKHRLNADIMRATGGIAPGAIKPCGEYGRFLEGLKSFLPMGFLANTTKVAGWASAVTVLYKSVEAGAVFAGEVHRGGRRDGAARCGVPQGGRHDGAIDRGHFEAGLGQLAGGGAGDGQRDGMGAAGPVPPGRGAGDPGVAGGGERGAHEARGDDEATQHADARLRAGCQRSQRRAGDADGDLAALQCDAGGPLHRAGPERGDGEAGAGEPGRIAGAHRGDGGPDGADGDHRRQHDQEHLHAVQQPDDAAVSAGAGRGDDGDRGRERGPARSRAAKSCGTCSCATRG